MSEEKAAEVLGLDVSQASEKELRDRYLELAKQFHPDKNGDTRELNEKMQDINSAYEVLKKILGNHGTSYYLYTKQRIDELKRTYVNATGREHNLLVAKFINDKISYLEKFANSNQDTKSFDEEYEFVNKIILNNVKRFRKRKIDDIEKNYGIIDIKSRNMFSNFCNKISSLNNVYDIEDEYLDYMNKYRQEFRYGDVMLNDVFLDAQRAYLINTYIGNQPFDDKMFIDKGKEISKIIDDFFKSIDRKQSKIDYDIKLFALTNNIETNISKFKNNIFDNIIDKEYMVNYPYVMATINSKKIIINGYNLVEIYKIYNETKDILLVSVRENIWKRYDAIIENNGKIHWFNNIIEYFKENVANIIDTVDINKPYKPINLEKMLIDLVSRYDEMNKKRNIFIRELKANKLDNDLIDVLEHTRDYKSLENVLDKADKYLKELKTKKEIKDKERNKNLIISKFKSDFQFRISRLKSNIQLRVNYDDIKRQNIMDRIDKIFEFYKNDKLDNIDDLKKVEFLNYKVDLEIVNKILDKNDDKKRDSMVSDGFSDIEQIFKEKEKNKRIKIALDISNYLDNIYTKKSVIKNSNLMTYNKMDIRYYVGEILNRYIDGNINDVSGLKNIGFMDYDKDMVIINSYLDVFNSSRRRG